MAKGDPVPLLPSNAPKSGEVFRHYKGDLLININVWTPQQLTSEEKKVLEKLKTSDNFKPHPGKGDKSFFEKMKEYFN